MIAVLTVLAVITPIASASEQRSGAPVSANKRLQVDLSSGWRFHRADVKGAQAHGFDDSRWPAVNVPHTWNAEDGQDGGGDYYRGAAWYRRSLILPANSEGKRVFVEFDGANNVTNAYVNGKHLGEHRGGYARFRFDATDALRPGGGNVLAVRVDNSRTPELAPQSADFTFFGGIYRPVRLQIVDPVHLDMVDHGGPGVYATPRNVNSVAADVDVTSRLSNDSGAARTVRARATVIDAEGEIVQTVESSSLRIPPRTTLPVMQRVRIRSPHLWNGRQDPYLYSVSVEVLSGDKRVLDVVTQPLGLRTVAVNPNTGFSLNGVKLPLHGVNRHQDHLDKGWALGRAEEELDVQLMLEMGANALRTAHYQQSEHVYASTDRHGIVVYTEIPFVGTPFDDSVPENEAFRINVLQQMRELIRQTYNNPSVVFLGLGNELTAPDHDTDFANALLADLAEMVREEAVGRITAYANVFLNTDDNRLTSHAEASGYNRYEGWYTGTKEMIGPYLDALHLRNPDRNIGLSEYGAGTSIHQHQEPLTIIPPQLGVNAHGTQPEEYGSQFHESYWKQIDARPYLWGTFVWNMFDFAVDHRNEGGQAGRNTKGLVTYDRKIKKDAFYWYKVNWTTTPTIYITSRRWTERTEPLTQVKVYSNAESVELRVNGTSQGTATASDHIFSWPIQLQPGDNEVVATSVIGGKTYTDNVV